MWAAKQISHMGSDFAFPKYCGTNKWLKPRVPEACVIHSFRHSIRNRLRAVECPTDIIDAIGGWSTEGVGQHYGVGFDLKLKSKWMKKLTYD